MRGRHCRRGRLGGGADRQRRRTCRHRRRHHLSILPSKTDLIAELVAAVAGRELDAMRAAAGAAAGPLSSLAACIAILAARALNERRLIWAVIGEPVDADVDAMRLDFRQSLAAELEARIGIATTGGHLPSKTLASQRRPSSVR